MESNDGRPPNHEPPGRVLLVGDRVWRERIGSRLEGALPDLTQWAADDVRGAYGRIEDAERVDCVATGAGVSGEDGLWLLESLREGDSDAAVVMGIEDGGDDIARDAVAAGVAGYLPDVSEVPDERVTAAIADAVGVVRADRDRSRSVERFEALFGAPDKLAWLLGTDGTVRRVNDGALEHVAASESAVTGTPFWETAWWEGGDARERLEDEVVRALAGETVRFETSVGGRAGATGTVELSLRPVTDDEGAVVGVVAEGTDISDRAELERELRRSEELHRVTLNNMTDTILITNDEGEFTYVCPNVHFIFGYTVDEIYEFGTIGALLGEGLFDDSELDADGILTNIECTATDRHGEEHTLLVNVKRVAIQGGTTLYSCRDITKRKEREQALTALHNTARDMLYAETRTEIGSLVVDDATDILDLPGAAVYVFDKDSNVLDPIASSPSMEAFNGPLSRLEPGYGSITGYTFVEDVTETFDDIHDSELLANPATDLRSAMFIPLGDYGVFVVASDERGVLDEVRQELAYILAATAEAALDRVARESELRSRDRELQQRNRDLSRLNQVNEIIREIDQALVRAETRAEIEHAVCERLTSVDRFALAWVGEADPATGDVRTRAWAGDEQGYLDTTTISVAESAEPTGRAARTHDVATVSNVADDLRDESWRTAALSRGYQSVVSVPLAHDDFSYGTLTVYADRADAFSGLVGTVFRELGETIASALGSIERKNALLSDEVVELEYEVTDPNATLLRVARRADCTLELEGGIRPVSDGVLAFVTVEDANVSRVLEVAADSVGIDRAREISSSENGGLVQLRLTTPFIATTLVDHGAVLRHLRADPDSVRLTIDTPGTVETRTVDELVTTQFPESQLLAQRERERPLSVRERIRTDFLDAVTDRQLEVVQTAYHSGFFESPREHTGEDVAAALGISPPAFYKHTRTVQRKLFTALFEGSLPPQSIG